MPRIVVVGGGFAGASCARALKRLDRALAVTLIEPSPRYTACPLSNAMVAGQLDLSCAACHDDNWGKRLGGSLIPQAHPTAYPLYRLEWQSLGSLQRRMRNCMIGVRAEPFDFGAPELVDLELYLM
ncbi:FAD-dependent oxidoreductase [Azotobacter armeniacus]